MGRGDVHAAAHPSLIREQPEEQVLDLDPLVSHLPGLVLRAPNRLARWLCEHLEHTLSFAAIAETDQLPLGSEQAAIRRQ
jgi:hypothetical protein